MLDGENWRNLKATFAEQICSKADLEYRDVSYALKRAVGLEIRPIRPDVYLRELEKRGVLLFHQRCHCIGLKLRRTKRAVVTVYDNLKHAPYDVNYSLVQSILTDRVNTWTAQCFIMQDAVPGEPASQWEMTLLSLMASGKDDFSPLWTAPPLQASPYYFPKTAIQTQKSGKRASEKNDSK